MAKLIIHFTMPPRYISCHVIVLSWFYLPFQDHTVYLKRKYLKSYCCHWLPGPSKNIKCPLSFLETSVTSETALWSVLRSEASDFALANPSWTGTSYPLTLTVSTEATHRRSLIGMPWSVNCHANFTSASKEHVQSEQCNEPQNGDKTDHLVKILVFKLKKQKTLVTTTMLDGEEEEMTKMEVRKFVFGRWNMKFQIVTCMTVELSVPRYAYF